MTDAERNERAEAFLLRVTDGVPGFPSLAREPEQPAEPEEPGA